MSSDESHDSSDVETLDSDEIDGYERVLGGPGMFNAFGFDDNGGFSENESVDERFRANPRKGLSQYGTNLFLAPFISGQIRPAPSRESRLLEIKEAYRLNFPMCNRPEAQLSVASRWVRLFHTALFGSSDEIRACIKRYATYATVDSRRPASADFPVRAYSRKEGDEIAAGACLLYTSPSPRD